MEQKCRYGLTLEQCNKKWEPPCQSNNHDCELLRHNNISQKGNKIYGIFI